MNRVFISLAITLLTCTGFIAMLYAEDTENASDEEAAKQTENQAPVFKDPYRGLRLGARFDSGVASALGSPFNDYLGTTFQKGRPTTGGTFVLDFFFLKHLGISIEPTFIGKGGQFERKQYVTNEDTKEYIEDVKSILKMSVVSIPFLLKTRFSIFNVGVGIGIDLILSGSYTHDIEGEVNWGEGVLENWNTQNYSFIMSVQGEIKPFESVPIFFTPGITFDYHINNELPLDSYTEDNRLLTVIFHVGVMYNLVPFNIKIEKIETKKVDLTEEGQE